MYQLFSGARPAARPPSAAPPDFQHSHFRRSLYHEQPPQSLPSSGEDEEGLGLGTPFSADDDEVSSGGGEGIAIDSTHYSDRSSARKRKLVEEQLCKLARVRLGDSIPRKSAGTSMGSSNLQSHIQPSSPLYNLSTGMARPLPCEGPDVNQPPGKRPRFFVGPKETSHRLVEVSRGGDSDSSSDDCERYVVLPRNIKVPSILPKEVAEEISRRSQEDGAEKMAIVPFIPPRATEQALRARRVYMEMLMQEDAEDADDEMETLPS